MSDEPDFEGAKLPPDFNPVIHAHKVRGHLVLSADGIVKCLQHAGVDHGLVQVIANRLSSAAMDRMKARVLIRKLTDALRGASSWMHTTADSYETLAAEAEKFNVSAHSGRREPTEDQIARAWDRLLADGWTKPDAPTSAISDILREAMS